MGPQFQSKPDASTLPQHKVKSTKPSLASAFGSFGVGIGKARKRTGVPTTTTDDEAANAVPRSFHLSRPSTHAGVASKKAIVDPSQISSDLPQPAVTSSIPLPSRSPPRPTLPKVSTGSSNDGAVKSASLHQRRPSTAEGTNSTATSTTSKSPDRPKINTSASTANATTNIFTSSESPSKPSPTSASPTSSSTTNNAHNPLRPTSTNSKTVSTFASGTASLKAKLRFIPGMENKAPALMGSSMAATASSLAKRPASRSKLSLSGPGSSSTINSINNPRSATPPTTSTEGSKKTRRLPISPLSGATGNGNDTNGAVPVRKVVTPLGGGSTGLVKRRIADLSKGNVIQSNHARKSSGSSLSSPAPIDESATPNPSAHRADTGGLPLDASTTTMTRPAKSITRTPASKKSLASIAYTESPGALTAPGIKSAAEGSVRIFDVEDEMPMGDISFTSGLDEPARGRKDEDEDEDEDEEGNVSALLPVDFGAPTPAIIRTRTVPDQFDEEEEDEEDDEDLDDGNDDDPTTMIPETPSRVLPRKPRTRPPALGPLPMRQNLSYLSPQPPSASSASFRLRPLQQSRGGSTSSLQMPTRARKDSAVSTSSTIGGASKHSMSNKRSARQPRPSLSRRNLRDRGSILSWEAVVERSKEFSEGELEDMAMLSGIGLNGLMRAMSPGFGTPMYHRMSFMGGSSVANSEVGGSRRHSKEVGQGGSKRSSIDGRDGRISFGLGDGMNIMMAPPDTPSPHSASASSPQLLHVAGMSPVPRLAVSPPPALRSHVDVKRAAEAEAELAKLRLEMQEQAAQLQALQSQLIDALQASEGKDATIVDMQQDRDTLAAEKDDLEAERAKAEREAQITREKARLGERLTAERDLTRGWGGVCTEAEAAMKRGEANRKVLDVLLSGLNVWRASVV
ncbi:hypothetical protein FRB96_005327 [Tulasnella sp. 330]|nr:hypothetical protein FRB96_005327 [Tulasnella sp. 330]